MDTQPTSRRWPIWREGLDLEAVLRLAVETGTRSPCAKSKRGVVIFSHCWLLAAGFNHPPNGFTCDGSAPCREHCNKLCNHAELDALRRIQNLQVPLVSDVEVLHVKVHEGEAVPSGPPSCWQCSRELLESRPSVGKVWLLHATGLRSYGAREFHRLTLEHCRLPALEV